MLEPEVNSTCKLSGYTWTYHFPYLSYWYICIYYRVLTFPGMKFWKSTRKVKAVKQEDYKSYKSKGRVCSGSKPKPVLLSDSDSEFETPKSQTDSISNEWRDTRKYERKETLTIKLEAINQRLNNLEAEFKAQSEVVRLQEKIVQLEADNRTLSKSVSDVKECFNCIICQAVATFPWMVVLCCSVVMCRNCFQTWSALQPSCPHCRATLD